MATINATYVTIWDDGDTTIETPVEVDLDLMEIISSTREREVYSEDTEVDTDNVDDYVETLVEEYVEDADGTRYTACFAEVADETDDEYGNGIVTYEEVFV